MKIQTVHFGEIEIDDEKVFSFPNGLPGLEEDKRFTLLSRGEEQPIRSLQSIDHWEIALPVVDPFQLLPSYECDLLEDDIAALSIDSPEDVLTLGVLVIPKEPEKMTINLVAPLIINLKNRIGRQIFLENRKYNVRTSVLELMRENAEV
jgi:flagellar assembly factor FliW